MKIYLFFLSLIISTAVFSQKKLEEANKFHETFRYVDEEKAYEEYLDEAKTVDILTWMNIGDTYYQLKEYQKANEAYEKWYLEPNRELNVIQGYQYLDSFRRLQRYDEANKIFERYYKEYGTKEKLTTYYEERDRFEELIKNDTLYAVEDAEFNSPYADFGGNFLGDEFIFSSARNKAENEISERDYTPYLALYSLNLSEGNQEQTPRLFNESLETPYHDATACFTKDGKTMYYASSFQNGKKKVFDGDKRNHFKIYRVDLTKKKLVKELLPFNVEGYSTGHPYITEDGSKLFFASDMPGGYGKADIYVCDVYPDGTFSKPRNLGPLLNTITDDFFPFFKGNVLFFSSAGHVGFGGLDMYKSFYRDGLFGTPINLGPVINTNADDFAYVEGKTPNTGYFSSDRAGGKGDDDIYEFTYNLESCQQFISGKVYDLETKQPLANATVTVYINQNDKYREILTDENGAYQLEVLCEKDYNIEASKAGYSKDGLNLSTDVTPGRTMKMLDFKIKDLSEIFTTDGNVEKIKVNPIYFEYYRYNINSVAAIQLQKVVDVMNAYPDMVIKIESHTDQRGTDYFNKVLSTNRAEATRDWLISRGIAPNRIESAIGYGESRPINICDEQGANCTEVEYSENRRSEFIVVRR